MTKLQLAYLQPDLEWIYFAITFVYVSLQTSEGYKIIPLRVTAHSYASNMAFVQLCGCSINSTTIVARCNSQSKVSYITLTSDINFKVGRPRCYVRNRQN
jgi:hypothetical protein